MENKKIVEIIEFTDPVCTWCWGSEPLLRKLETRYKDQIVVKFVMGGLVKDIRMFYDSFNNIGGDSEKSNMEIAKHWLEASNRHGMPVKVEGFNLFSNEYPSSYPQNIAYKAAQIENEELANRFLRRIREATATEGRQTNKTEVLIELANEVGLNITKFIERLSDGSAELAFEDDLYTTSSYDVSGFPTFLIKYGEKDILLRGYQEFESIKSVIKILTNDTVKDIEASKTEDDVLKFIEKYISVAPVEIQTAFEFSDSELKTIIQNLKKNNLVKLIPVGNNFFIQRQGNAESCDTRTGICSI